VSPAVAATRLEGLTDRPLLAGPDRARRIAELLARREAAYLSAPHVVPTDGRTPAQVAAEVVSLARDHAYW
jgi:shikimate kinase